MKRLLIVCMAILMAVSCQKEVAPTRTKEVPFTIGLQLPQSGSMMRATASELYDEFYANYIETHIKLPQNYNLSIYKGSERVASVNGKWNIGIITLPVGTYRFVGYSTGDFELASLEFDQEVTITEQTTSIDLIASYNCYLLFFDKEIFSSVSVSCRSSNSNTSTSESLCSTETLLYVFLPHREASAISYYTKGGNSGWIDLDDYTFENGKYYAFNIYTGTFTIPQMEPGN